MCLEDGLHVGKKYLQNVLGQHNQVFEPASKLGVESAAQWMLWDASGVYKANMAEYRYPDLDRPVLRSSLEKMALQDWTFWKDGLKKASLNENFSEVVRDMADKAVRMMDLVEEIMAWTKSCPESPAYTGPLQLEYETEEEDDVWGELI